MTDSFAQKKEATATWFKSLRDQICAEFEVLEREAPNSLYPGEPGQFVYEDWQRNVENGGGGTGGMLRGRLFEKCGVHISVVKGEFTPEMAARVPGAEKDPSFWAAGISLIAHLVNPRIPAVHMNTRYIVTTQDWFGGGGDLNPMVPVDEDTAFFHARYEDACTKHNPEYYPRYKAWADEYFMIRHRGFARGVGGIFYDDHNTGDWEADFAFTQDVGRAFLASFPPLVERRMHESWKYRSSADVDATHGELALKRI